LCYGLNVHSETPKEPAAPAKLGWRERLQEYGSIGIVTYFVVFGLTIVGFFIAISAGYEVEGVVGQSSTWFAAWLATKVTQPLRIAVVLALTPIVAAAWHKIRPKAIATVPPPAIVTPESDTRPDP
jgi:hypothetical protein